ncbi:MAG: endopeptidase La [Thermoanaerobaculaceae bacterium]|nr:endopeptidase La [Thermoanaerobaculaceae bacterium]MDI9622439.1 endopeptidase La [Acidobacteriota bacterium]NLH11194.1 endopeptidase La [Holophagae bacterium]HPW54340.1 endopeptidase La [Thermoanaerobaculaceae bacterium]
MPSPEIRILPVVPLRDMVVFPRMKSAFVVGRPASVAALRRALEEPGKQIFLVTQKDPQQDEPGAADVFECGVIASILQHVTFPNGTIKVGVEGMIRGRWQRLYQREGAGYEAHVEVLAAPHVGDQRLGRYLSVLTNLFQQYARVSQQIGADAVLAELQTEDPEAFSDALAAALPIPTPDKQGLLEMVNPLERLQRLNDLLDVEIEKLNIDRRLNAKVKKQMEKAQREYYLSEKIKAINEELGRTDTKEELEELARRIETAGMPKEAKEKALGELKRLESMAPMSAEATVSRNYLDWLLSVPWKKSSKEHRDVTRAEEVLDEDHYGLTKVKERILEFLAVRQLVRKPKGSILCFVGPPGVGKTSLAKSIARATGRKFVRLSLGGVRDEAEIRGHRRTYIGAFPGQIIQMMKKAGTTNPVFLLDEVDKLASDFRGDPAAALLEVLDPEQNHTFVDHYLDVEYDLSRVFFIATANVTHTIPPALQDRMETIQLSGYTHYEKLQIAKQFLVRKQVEQQGLANFAVEFSDDAITLLVERYTREAGVRNLEREISSCCRKLAREVLKQATPAGAAITVTPEKVRELLGKPRYRLVRASEQAEVGVATGLAWTEVGGELLSTEVGLMRGKGALTLTGQLGEVMQESARAALSYVRARSPHLSLPADFFDTRDIHVHVPEGAIPKDGPSAGITMGIALLSAVAGVPVRQDIAMTGEITLRGKVLPVGGIKDKVLAAFRAGLREVILPVENEKDLEDIPEEVRSVMQFHFVKEMDEVVALALTGALPTLQAVSTDEAVGKTPASLSHQ